MTMKKVSGDLAKNRDYLDRQLGVGESFDVLYRNVEIGKKNAALYMIDGFCKADAGGRGRDEQAACALWRGRSMRRSG